MVQEVTDKMSEEDIKKGEKKYGGAKQFVNAIVLSLAFKAALITKGVTVGLAAKAGAIIVFGAGSLCHSVACATGAFGIDAIGDGIDMIGDFAVDVSDFSFGIADGSVHFFSDLIDGVGSFFDLIKSYVTQQ